jgi:hypothetical protein
MSEEKEQLNQLRGKICDCIVGTIGSHILLYVRDKRNVSVLLA